MKDKNVAIGVIVKIKKGGMDTPHAGCMGVISWHGQWEYLIVDVLTPKWGIVRGVHYLLDEVKRVKAEDTIYDIQNRISELERSTQ